MVSAIGPTGTQRMIDPLRTGAVRRTAAASQTATAEAAAPVATPAALLTAEGPPIDTDKVATIRAGIANGSYRADPQAIAQRMMALDLPGSGQ